MSKIEIEEFLQEKEKEDKFEMRDIFLKIKYFWKYKIVKHKLKLI